MNTSYTILCVDDDPDDLMLLTEAFQKVGTNLRVEHASNGFIALKKLEEMNQKSSLPCLIILDINMPLMDGKETLRNIKGNPELQKIPVVIFSTSTSEADKTVVHNLGADFITKPISYSDMHTLAHQFLSKCNIQFNKATA